MRWVRLSPKPERNLGPSTQPYLNTEESSEGGWGGKVGRGKRKGKRKKAEKSFFFLIQPLEVAKIIILM